MDDKSNKTKKPSNRDLDRPPAKPGPRNGLGRQPTSTGEGNSAGSNAGLDANDKTKTPNP
ncbi:MAG TPA: hypothetical protein VH082_06300 [Rudaea sp.]|jgi:hypothetical protein|nr:hypothetical protein [Rudaea sp.]